MFFENQVLRWIVFLVFLGVYRFFRDRLLSGYHEPGDWRRIVVGFFFMLIGADAFGEWLIVISSNLQLIFTIPLVAWVCISILIILWSWYSCWKELRDIKQRIKDEREEKQRDERLRKWGEEHPDEPMPVPGSQFIKH